MKSVYSAVRTGSLNKAVCASVLKGNHLQIIILIVSVTRLLIRPMVKYCKLFVQNSS